MNKALYVWFSPNFVKQTGHEIKTVGNPLATWEESTKLNVGLELGLFDALTLNVDVYKENRTGHLHAAAFAALDDGPFGRHALRQSG